MKKRKVKIRFKPERQPLSTEFNTDGEFHQWGYDFIEFESGPGNMTIGIVELSNGHVVKVDPEHIKFLK